MMSGARKSPAHVLSGDLLLGSDSFRGGKSMQELGELIFAEKWSHVRATVRRDPETASLRNWAKKTPLHMCCEQGAPLNVVRTLLDANPTAASMQDIFGYTPLHVAFVSNGCHLVVTALLRACPDALRVGDKQGYLPLHRAVAANMSVPILLELIEACPESVCSPSDRGSIPLDSASLSTVKQILSSAPAAARRNIGSVLHWACRPRPSATVNVALLIHQHPEAVRAANREGLLPLHVACLWRKYFPDTYLATLLRAYPEAAAVADGAGNTPLHHACRAGYTDRGEIKGAAEADAFRELIRASGRMALTRRNAEGRTPLHLACRSRALGPEAFRVLIGACPDAVRVRDRGGRTPVGSFMDGCCTLNTDHFMVHGLLMDEKVWEMLNVLLRTYFDDEADAPLEDASHTLHSCLRVQCCPRDFLWLVASQYPDQISAKDTRGRLPLHAAAAYLDGSEEATSFLLDLICHHPAALNERDDDGRYPLTHMIESERLWGDGIREAIICFPQALFDGAYEDHMLPCVLSRVGSTKRLEPMFELVRGKPHKIVGSQSPRLSN